MHIMLQLPEGTSPEYARRFVDAINQKIRTRPACGECYQPKDPNGTAMVGLIHTGLNVDVNSAILINDTVTT